MIRWGWICLLLIILSIEPSIYLVSFDAGADEIHLVIRDGSNTTPYLNIQSVDVDQADHTVSIPRHPLPAGGSYIIYAEAYVWMGCPSKCDLVWLGNSNTVIIHVPKK